MEDFSIWDTNVHQWRIQPGGVGSVGDVNVTPRLKHSSPDMPIRWANWAYGQNAPYLGSNAHTFETGNGQAGTVDMNWGGKRGFRTNIGWKVQDLTQADTLVEPFVSSLGDYSWRNRVATTYEAKRSGENFLPVPGEYILAPGEISRGGNQVRITDIVPGDYPTVHQPVNLATAIGRQPVHNPVIGGVGKIMYAKKI